MGSDLRNRFVARARACDETVTVTRPQTISRIKKGSFTMDTRYLNLTGAAIVLSCIAMAAQAGNPAADETIAVAKAAVERAEQSGAPQAAPVELASARDKLARAVKEKADHHLKPAIELADQATVDAHVAEATAQKERAARAAAEFDASMLTLRQESNRSSSANQ
jgi:hypothetical protein